MTDAPTTVEELRLELGMGRKRLAKLKASHRTEEGLIGQLQHLLDWKRAREDVKPRYLAAQNGYLEPKNYTTSPFRAVDDLSVVPEEYQDDLSRRRRETFNETRKQERLDAEQRSLEARISIAKKVAAIRGVDITRELWSMEKKLKNLEKRLYDKEAA